MCFTYMKMLLLLLYLCHVVERSVGFYASAELAAIRTLAIMKVVCGASKLENVLVTFEPLCDTIEVLEH